MMSTFATPSDSEHDGSAPQKEASALMNCWMAPGYSSRNVIRNLQKQINGGYPYLDQTGFYIDPVSSDGWAATSQQKTYQAMRHSLAYEDIADQLIHMLTVLEPTEELDIIALGPSQAFEECILAQLLAQSFKRIRVFLIDVSDGLLEEALNNMSSVTAHHPNVQAFAVRGDFHQLWNYLPEISKPKPGLRRLITAFTILYNLQDELAFMHNNFVHFEKDDLFLGDFIRTAAPVDDPEAIRGKEVRLSNQSVMGWDHALDQWHTSILKRYCHGFEGVRFDYRLDVHGCLIPGSYAVDKVAHIQLKDDGERMVVIQRYKRYPEKQFVYTFQRVGWMPVNAWHFGRLKERIVYLFQKNRGF